MANFPCEPLPHLPPGTSIIEPGPLRTKRNYMIVGGDLPMACDDWAIATLAPEIDTAEYDGAITVIVDYLEHRGLTVRHTSRCGMGTALVQFVSSCDRDTAVESSPHMIGDTVLRFVNQDRGINYRDASFTHDVWLMLVNYPLECWHVDTVVKTMTPYGRFLVWSKDNSNKARIVVKIRAYNVDTLPVSIVVLQNSSDNGSGGSWTCPTYNLSRNLIGAVGGDEDPILPDGENPHPMPNVFHGFWHDLHNDFHANPDPVPVVIDVENGNVEVIQIPDTSEIHHNINLNELPEEHETAAIQDLVQPVDQDINVLHDDNTVPNIPAVEVADNMVDPITAIQGLVASVIANSHDIFSKLENAQIVGASGKLVDVHGDDGLVRQCFLQIQTVEKLQKKKIIREVIDISEIPSNQEMGIRKRRKKATVPTTVTAVRRSRRIAGVTLGYKYIASAIAAGAVDDAITEPEQETDEAEDMVNEYEAVAVDASADPPPHLPLETVQAIAVGHCKMHPGDVSEEALLYDSSNDE
ncbi:hypothetical protein ACQ4PT_040437 [Festuca glaucescens]